MRLGPHSPSARPCSCRITPLQASCIPSASGLLPPHFLAGVPGPLPHTPSSPQVTSRPSTVRFRDRPLGQIQAGIQPTFPTPPPTPSSSLTCLQHHPVHAHRHLRLQMAYPQTQACPWVPISGNPTGIAPVAQARVWDTALGAPRFPTTTSPIHSRSCGLSAPPALLWPQPRL